MLIIIKSYPYQSEDVMGALFIALSSAEANHPTSVIFCERGLNCLFNNQNDPPTISMPAISDIIKSLIGSVKFYWIPSNTYEIQKELISGIKSISYKDLIEKTISEEGKNILIF